MGLFDKFFKKPQVSPEELADDPITGSEKPEKKRRSPRPSKAEEPPKLTAKEVATKNGEPYITVLKMDIDPNNVNSGAFELDWNEKFIMNLIRAGYKIKQEDTDAEMVDRWFQNVCRNIALELYEQQQADPTKRDDIRVVRQRDLGNGRTEVS